MSVYIWLPGHQLHQKAIEDAGPVIALTETVQPAKHSQPVHLIPHAERPTPRYLNQQTIGVPDPLGAMWTVRIYRSPQSDKDEVLAWIQAKADRLAETEQ